MTAPLLVERSRGVLAMGGRDPVRMIQGLATADVAAASPRKGVYTAFLTAKGRMVAVARVFVPAGDGPPLLLDVDPAARDALVDHIRRFVPPLFGKAEDVTDGWSVLGVYGPGSGRVVAAAATALLAGPPPDAHVLEQGDVASEETVVQLEIAEGAFACRTALTGDEGWDLFLPTYSREAMVTALLAAGARPGAPEALEALRVAAGQPRWGMELTDGVIPLEAGLLERAISQTKGCYTGQEVIVRILHRGHVNRYLRRLVFEAGAPAAGTELFEPGAPKPRGVVTSAVENDAGALGLGYVRREVEPPAELLVGAPDGPAVRVEALD